MVIFRIMDKLTLSCENTKPSGFATTTIYQSTVLATCLVAASVELNNSLIIHVAAADEAHSLAWKFAWCRK